MRRLLVAERERRSQAKCSFAGAPDHEPVLERVVGARVEKPLLDLRFAVPAHQVIFSRNERYVYYRSIADGDTLRRS